MILIRGDIARVHPAANTPPAGLPRTMEHFPDGLRAD
jgi:hypothetical protein